MKALRWITAGALIFAVSSVGCLRALKKGLANIAADEGPKHEVIVPEYKDYTSATTPFTLNYPVVPLKNATASKVLNQLIFEDVEATSIIVGALAADPNFAGAKFNGAYCFSEKGEDAVYNCYTTEESCKELESKLDATYLGESCSRRWNADFNNPSGYSNK